MVKGHPTMSRAETRRASGWDHQTTAPAETQSEPENQVKPRHRNYSIGRIVGRIGWLGARADLTYVDNFLCVRCSCTLLSIFYVRCARDRHVVRRIRELHYAALLALQSRCYDFDNRPSWDACRAELITSASK